MPERPPDMTFAAPSERQTSRIVILDPSDRVLLFRAETAAGMWLWFPPGGGVEPGETYEASARRELWEETGMEQVRLGPALWRRNFLLTTPDPAFGEGPVRFLERYFLLRVPAPFEPRPMAIGRYEGYMREQDWFHWWSLEEIEASTGYERFVPPRLQELLRPVVTGRVPDEPLEIGE
jgi:8-oxo-dGTP pyrophosphatase MutT (NUDIX family)